MENRHEDALRRIYQADRALARDGRDPDIFSLTHSGGLRNHIHHPRWDPSWATPSEHTIDDLGELGYLRVEPPYDKRRSFALTMKGREKAAELVAQMSGPASSGEGPTFHVRVAPVDAKDLLSGPIYALDLSEEEMINRFIAPYQAQAPIEYGDRALDRYMRPKITRFARSGRKVVEDIRERQRNSRQVHSPYDAEELFFEKGSTDVTDRYLDPSRPAPNPQPGPPAPRERSIFVVHGHGRKDEVARFLRDVTGREPTVLSERAGQGRTIIEKFEEEARDAAYAVVLLTADDVGRARDGEELRPRARQNAVLELGYFIGHIGRGNVAVLYEDGVEIPSDYKGVEYISFAGNWQATLVRELQGTGVEAAI